MLNRFVLGRALGAVTFVVGLLALAFGLNGFGIGLLAVGAGTYVVTAYMHAVHRDAVAGMDRQPPPAGEDPGTPAAAKRAHGSAMPQWDDRRPSVAVERATHFAGTGALIQALGLVAPFAGYYFFDMDGAAIGIGALVVLFVVGSHKAISWRCGACTNPIAHRDVRLCPVCGTRLHR